MSGLLNQGMALRVLPKPNELQCGSSFCTGFISVIWKVRHFSRFALKENRYILSPLFRCCEASWALWLYPRGQTHNDTAGHVSLYVVKKVCDFNNDHSVSFKIGLKDLNGEDEHTFQMQAEVIKDLVYGCHKLIATNELLQERQTELLLNDTLTVFCEIKASRGKTVELCDTSTMTLNTGTDILVRDLSVILNDHVNCDVTLQVNQEKFHAHKLILAARSTVFAAMFEHDMEENRTCTVTITDIPPEDFKELLQYVYTGNLREITMDRAIGLYVAADKYDLKELKYHCAEIIVASLSLHKFCEVAALAHMCNDGMMIDAIKEFARQNSSSLLSSKEWKDLLKLHTEFASEILLSVSQDLREK